MSEPLPCDLIPDLDARQDEALRKIDELNLRIEGVLKELSPGGSPAASGQAE